MSLDEWTGHALGDLCSFKAGSAFPQAEQGETSGEFPFIKVSDMNLSGNEVRITTANNWVSSQTARKLKAKPLPVGTPIFAKIGEALKANRVRRLSRPTIVDNNMMGAVPNQDVVDELFLFYLLGEVGLPRWATGTSVPYLTVAVLSQIPVTIPLLPTQQRIAAILSAYDDMIENNTRRIALLEEMARRLYEEWFVHFRFPGHEEAEFEIGVPVDWKMGVLKDVIVLQRGFDLPKKTRTPGPHPVYAATGQHGNHKEAKVKGPGVVTGRSGSLGTVVYVEKDFWPLNTTLWGKEFPLGSALFAYFVLSDIDLLGFNSGAAVPTLNRNDVHELPLVLPNKKLIAHFEATVQPMFDLVRSLERKNANLRTQRDLVLPKLISGEIDMSGAEAALEAAE